MNMLTTLNKSLIRGLLFVVMVVFSALSTASVSDIKEQLLSLGDNYSSEMLTVQVRSDRWTHYNFSQSYVDPVVVPDRADITAFTQSGQNLIIGVRNVTSTGVDIKVNPRYAIDYNKAEDVVVNVSFSVVDLSTLPPDVPTSSIFQLFGWGWE